MPVALSDHTAVMVLTYDPETWDPETAKPNTSEWYQAQISVARKMIERDSKLLPDLRRAHSRAAKRWKTISESCHTIITDECIVDTNPTSLRTCLCGTCIWIGIWEDEKRYLDAKEQKEACINNIRQWRAMLGESLTALELLTNPPPSPPNNRPLESLIE